MRIADFYSNKIDFWSEDIKPFIRTISCLVLIMSVDDIKFII